MEWSAGSYPALISDASPLGWGKVRRLFKIELSPEILCSRTLRKRKSHLRKLKNPGMKNIRN